MIKADVLITNKNWKKYIRTPEAYINKQLKKLNKKTNLFKNNDLHFTLLLAGSILMLFVLLRQFLQATTTHC